MNLGKIGDLGKIMQQAMQMQEAMKTAQEELGKEVVEYRVAAGKVTVRMNGHQELIGLEIHPDVITPEDPVMLQDLIFSAFINCQRRARELAEDKMKGITGGMMGPLGM